MKRIIVSVINDLVTDQRVSKVCTYLHKNGFDVLLVGRVLPASLPMDERPYASKRMKLFFTKGPFFYAEYNIRLFFLLLFSKCDILLSNDLDTLMPNYLVSKLRRKAIVYDSHEYFTETPEVINRKFVQSVWRGIEKWIFPKLPYVFTVNDSIADLFEKSYGNRPLVVRNIPPVRHRNPEAGRKTLGLPEDKHILLLQGAGINIQRGAEELLLSMQYVESALLLIIGNGDVLPQLKQMCKKNQLEEKIRFIPRQLPQKLFDYTCQADLAFSLDKDTNPNYRYSLPNKLFDYMHAGVPVLVSRLPEISKVVTKYECGDFIDHHDPKHIAGRINAMLGNPEELSRLRKNCFIAAKELSWENEEKQLDKVYLNLK